LGLSIDDDGELMLTDADIDDLPPSDGMMTTGSPAMEQGRLSFGITLLYLITSSSKVEVAAGFI
jgi:hypothetical protein